MDLTNRDLHDFHEIIFAHGPEFYATGQFVGREQELDQGAQFVADAGPRFMVVSEPLGSGKTWLIKQLIRGRLSPSKTHEPILSVRAVRTVDDLRQRQLDGFIALDEADQKIGLAQAYEALRIASQLPTDDGTKIVVIGDQSVKDVELVADLVGMRPERGSRLRLVPLDRDLLVQALTARIEYFSSDMPDKAESASRLIDPAVARWLLPLSSVPVATFRGVLSILDDIASSRAIPLNGAPARITPEVVAAWASSKMPATDDPRQVGFLIGLRDALTSARDDEASIPVLNAEDWERLIRVRGVSGVEAYESEILRPLARAGWLVATGVPDVQTTEPTGPFAPSVKTLLRSAFDPRWP